MKMKNKTPLLTVPSRSSLKKHAFYGIVALVSLLLLGITQSARAYTVTMQQMGSNVVANGSGAFNLTGLTPLGPASGSSNGILPSSHLIFMGDGSVTALDGYTGYTGPTGFGSGGVTLADTGSGDFVVLYFTGLYVPQGYVSGNALLDSITFNNTNFATLGVMEGTYVWSWGTGPNQNFTLNIGGSVPDGGSTVGLLGFALAGLGILRRKLRC
jgi:VPDSG-CTERM motif